MKNRLVIWTAVLFALVGAGTVPAHHSIGMFELSTPVWVKGTVVSYVAINPHTLIVLDETASDGSVRRWLVEGPSLQRLERMEIGTDFIQAGDVMQVCGFPPKAEFSSQRPSPRTVGYPSQTVHGHVLQMPDGQMRLWGPYGKLENCIRPDDETQTWVNFVNSDGMARSAWCASRVFVRVASLPPKEFVDEVSSLMTNPCD